MSFEYLRAEITEIVIRKRRALSRLATVPDDCNLWPDGELEDFSVEDEEAETDRIEISKSELPTQVVLYPPAIPRPDSH